MTKKVITVVLLLLVVTVAAFMVCNSKDSAQLPQVSDLLSRQPQATGQEIKGYQYLIAIMAAPDKDPAQVGADVYNKISKLTDKDDFEKAHEYLSPLRAVEMTTPEPDCARKFCDGKELAAEKAKDTEILTKYDFLLKRFKTLVSFGGFASGLRPNILWSMSRILAIFNISHIQYIEWNRRLAKGDYKKVLGEMRAVNKLVVSPLNHISSSLEMSVAAIILKHNREFIVDAAKAYPQIRSLCDDQCQKDFTISKSFDEVLPQQFAFELQSIDGFLRRRFDDSAVANIFIEMPGHGILKSLTRSNFSYSLVLQRNRTLNSIYSELANAASDPCVKADTACPQPNYSLPPFKYFINPAGRLLALTFNAGASRYRELNKNLLIDQAPLKF